MECRTPLYVIVARPHQQRPERIPSYRTPRQPPSPPMPPIKKRLPLPKNVVLLSLIEATELATEDATKSEASPRGHKNDMYEYSNATESGHHRRHTTGDDNSIAVIVDAEDLEEERIKLGTSMAVSVAGTYAVTDPKGLPIYATRPSRAQTEDAFRKDHSQQTSDEDVDKLVRYFHLDQQMNIDSTEDELKENRAKEQPPAQLSCGDRVQVVAIEGGWSKLARGYGYVQADDNKLVKVGNSVDRACKLEAMLRSLSSQRKRLRLEQSRVDNMFIRLMNDLQISLMTDEDLTVIVADTFAQAPNDQKPEYRQANEARDQMPPRHNGEPTFAGPFKPKISKPQLEERQDTQGTPTAMTNAARGFACFANDVFDTISGTGSDDTAEYHKLRRQQGISPPRAAGAAQKGGFEGTTCNIPYAGCSVPANVATTLFPAASHPSPSAMSAGARAWRELHGREEAKGGGVDFKTGMSGHMALLSSHAHPHEYLGTHRHAIANFRGMSNHTGLTMTKPLKKCVGALYQSMYQSLYPALNMPSLSGGTAERADHTDSRSDRSDSM